jgi:Zn finger protein HypA/HybF involved in hydrogenase expression
MHESKMVIDLLHQIETVARQHGEPKVKGVTLQIGALMPLSPALLTEQFEHVAEGTIAEHANLRIRVGDRIDDPMAQSVVLESLELEAIDVGHE